MKNNARLMSSKTFLLLTNFHDILNWVVDSLSGVNRETDVVIKESYRKLS